MVLKLPNRIKDNWERLKKGQFTPEALVAAVFTIGTVVTFFASRENKKVEITAQYMNGDPAALDNWWGISPEKCVGVVGIHKVTKELKYIAYDTDAAFIERCSPENLKTALESKKLSMDGGIVLGALFRPKHYCLDTDHDYYTGSQELWGTGYDIYVARRKKIILPNNGDQAANLRSRISKVDIF